MTKDHPGNRIFILGAGFSQPAGLPLAPELFPEVRKRIEQNHGSQTKFARDLEEYKEYRLKCDSVAVDDADIDLEELLSYLDIEHFLGLRGGDTWSDEGNEGQILIKSYIGQLISERTPSREDLPDQYYEFAAGLRKGDIVITFNYDVVLERALDHIGKPYRLFPQRFKEIGLFGNVVDSDNEEVAILKVHGSIDWFTRELYDRSCEHWEQLGHPGVPKHLIFNDLDRFEARPITDGPRSEGDPLQQIYRVEKIDEYYSGKSAYNVPLILSPSHIKFVYANPFLDFWFGLGRAGGMNLGVSIIGFSLPAHDEYVRIALFNLIDNYQNSWWDEEFLGFRKANVKLVDKAENDADISKYKERYRFVDSDKTDYFFDGFCSEAVSLMFS